MALLLFLLQKGHSQAMRGPGINFQFGIFILLLLEEVADKKGQDCLLTLSTMLLGRCVHQPRWIRTRTMLPSFGASWRRWSRPAQLAAKRLGELSAMLCSSMHQYVVQPSVLASAFVSALCNALLVLHGHLVPVGGPSFPHMAALQQLHCSEPLVVNGKGWADIPCLHVSC